MNVEQRDFIDLKKDTNELDYSYTEWAIDDIINNTEWFDKSWDSIKPIVSLIYQLEKIKAKNSEQSAKLEVAINKIINEWLENKLWNDIKNIKELSDFFKNLNLSKNWKILNILSNKTNELAVANVAPDIIWDISKYEAKQKLVFSNNWWNPFVAALKALNILSRK